MLPDSSRPGRLVVVGAGIKLASDVTLEAKYCIEQADQVFFAVIDPATEAWILRLNPAGISLFDCYAEGKRRRQTYQEMSDRILDAVRQGASVCAVFYGHPGLMTDASHDAIRRARLEGFSARMLPGISSQDTLFADLDVDPGASGCQSFEATDFLRRRRRFDPTSALVLWQVGVLGESTSRIGMTCRPERLRVLTDTLRRHYSDRHPVILYEAAQFPICDPMIDRITLAQLPRQIVRPVTTLYIPPKPTRRDDPEIRRWLERMTD